MCGYGLGANDIFWCYGVMVSLPATVVLAVWCFVRCMKVHKQTNHPSSSKVHVDPSNIIKHTGEERFHFLDLLRMVDIDQCPDGEKATLSRAQTKNRAWFLFLCFKLDLSLQLLLGMHVHVHVRLVTVSA